MVPSGSSLLFPTLFATTHAKPLVQMDIAGCSINYARTDLKLSGIQLVQLAQQEINGLGMKPNTLRKKISSRFRRPRQSDDEAGEDEESQLLPEPDRELKSRQISLRFWIR